jgi:hypothetical protein
MCLRRQSVVMGKLPSACFTDLAVGRHEDIAALNHRILAQELTKRLQLRNPVPPPPGVAVIEVSHIASQQLEALDDSQAVASVGPRGIHGGDHRGIKHRAKQGVRGLATPSAAETNRYDCTNVVQDRIRRESLLGLQTPRWPSAASGANVAS